ncbi:CAP domain-containing protein [Mycobacterium saskatchewanense]|uniref:SCP domain-containing protein n=1 Tax=Mycobacterium saskatchewanense TaxID=220927 RepID=A0AAJ3NM17_9MYCO|nr:CAP domain-containing protein [Mycobacterium saskatchewanense]ORW68107.1 hypothetical protein AWC23_22025 [Mycobacterium saskatchewanense]
MRQPLVAAIVTGAAVLSVPVARADNKRLNDGVVSNVYTVQQQAGCTNNVTVNLQLQQAAEWHAHDLVSNRSLDGDIGTDGSTPQSRSAAAGFRGPVSETVAINPALAISGIELINQWYYNPDYYAIMSNCANSQIGVWSENSPGRTVVVAVYGQPPPGRSTVQASPHAGTQDAPVDPGPDYDASDEIEFGTNWFAWILRGVYPPPAYPPN